MKPERT